MKIVVTGGTGFLGSRLVQRLRENAATEVVIVARSCGHDIRRAESLRQVFDGAHTVFHLAALVQSRPGSFLETNVRGLINVLEASVRAGAKRLVYVSSFTVFGPSFHRAHDEQRLAARSHFFHGYDRTKYEALQVARDWQQRLPLNIVFPTVIFGPGRLTEGNIMVHLFRRWLRFRLAPLPLGGKPVWNFVFVDDVVEGLLKVVDADPGEDFILGANNSSLLGLCQALGRLAGTNVKAIGLPAAIFKLSSYFEDYASRIGKFPPLVVPSTAGFFLNNWEFSSEKANRLLGYVPRELDEGLDYTIRWMREQNLA